MGVYDFLSEYNEGEPVRFHMPGHKGWRFFEGLGFKSDQLINMDITEIPGADDLFHQDGIIADLTQRYRRMYRALESFLLVNGSSCGLIASLITVARMSEMNKGSGRVLVARNCHKSVFNGLRLCGLSPVYVFPEILEDEGISGELSVEEVRAALTRNPDIEAVIVTSPNYYGIQSGIRGLAEVAHKFGAALIVDQAHGAHLKFMEEDLDAGTMGADLVISSTHKTMASFTQTAIANFYSRRIDPEIYADALQCVESSSPSYLFLLSFDWNARVVEEYGEVVFDRWQKNLDRFYKEAAEIEGMKMLDCRGLDPSKIMISFRAKGLTGKEVEKRLIHQNIYPEMSTGDWVMCLSGIGNTEEDYRALVGALRVISEEVSAVTKTAGGSFSGSFLSVIKKHPLKTGRLLADTLDVDFREAEGCVCVRAVVPYPPGIPLICPGELWSREAIHCLEEILKRGEGVEGLEDGYYVKVVKRKL